MLKNDKDRRVQNCEELTAGLQHKTAVMKDLESDIFVCSNSIHTLTSQILVLDRQLKEDHLRAHDI